MKTRTRTVVSEIVLEVEDFTKEQMDTFIASFENIKATSDIEDKEDFSEWALFDNDDFYDENNYDSIFEIVYERPFLEKCGLDDETIYYLMNDEIEIDYSNIKKELEKHL